MSDANRPGDEARYTVLSKLAQIGPMNLLEIGFSATPHVIRNMAARGMVKVTVEITARGSEHLAKEKAKKLRKVTNEQKAARMADRMVG